MSSDGSKPLTLDSVEAALSSAHGIDVRALPTGTDLVVSQSAAVTTAMEFAGTQSPAADVSAFAVTATARNYGKVLPDGTLELRISDRRVWLVLVPNFEVHSRGVSPDPRSYIASLAVLIDGSTGERLLAATVY
jgi:hypothetical protein